MISYKLFEMRETVKKELEHVYPGNLYQNMLRNFYFNLRMASLGSKADKSEYPNDKNKILKKAIIATTNFAKESNVKFIPHYDLSFFKIAKSKEESTK